MSLKCVWICGTEMMPCDFYGWVININSASTWISWNAHFQMIPSRIFPLRTSPMLWKAQVTWTGHIQMSLVFSPNWVYHLSLLWAGARELSKGTNKWLQPPLIPVFLAEISPHPTWLEEAEIRHFCPGRHYTQMAPKIPTHSPCIPSLYNLLQRGEEELWIW